MTLTNKQHGNHEPSFTTESILIELEQKLTKKNNALIDLMKSRNHELVSGVYKNINSVIVFFLFFTFF
jgi:hypothetical protein